MFRAAVVCKAKKRDCEFVQEVSAEVLRKAIADRMAQAPANYCDFVEVGRLNDYLQEGEDLEEEATREKVFISLPNICNVSPNPLFC